MGCSSSLPTPLPDCVLTSSAVTKTENNVYAWEQKEWLIPHEPIRREMLRAERALELMDNVQHEWHIKAFFKWYSEFFSLAIHFHHDNEEKIVGPYFQALGEVVDFGKTCDHEQLLASMTAFEADLKTLFDLVTGASKAAGVDIKTKEDELRAKWRALKELMFTHLAEEEVFWPAVYTKHGQKHAKILVDKILKADMNLTGKEAVAGHAFAGAVMDAMGAPCVHRYKEYNYSTPPHALTLGPWLNSVEAERFWNDIFFVPRLFILPGFHKEYLVKWRVLIESIGSKTAPSSI